MNYNNLENVIEMADRAKNADLDILLDFHYSDTWVDPFNQIKPVAWEDLPFEILCDIV